MTNTRHISNLSAHIPYTAEEILMFPETTICYNNIIQAQKDIKEIKSSDVYKSKMKGARISGETQKTLINFLCANPNGVVQPKKFAAKLAGTECALDTAFDANQTIDELNSIITSNINMLNRRMACLSQ